MPTPDVSAITAPRRQQVVGAIADAARATGVDFRYLLGQARLESGLNPTARARTSSATGLYQFIDQSWLAVVHRHGPSHGLGWAAGAISRGEGGRWSVADPDMRRTIMALRNDPAVASRMAAEHAADNRAFLEPRIGRAAQPVDLYLAHFLGPAGAARFLTAHARNPQASGAAMFPQAAAANRPIFYGPGGAPRTLDDIRDRFAARLAAAGEGAPAGLPGIAEPQPEQQQVQPADWLRIARAHETGSAADAATGPAGSLRLSTGVADDPLSLLAPARARLAYMMLAATGATL